GRKDGDTGPVGRQTDDGAGQAQERGAVTNREREAGSADGQVKGQHDHIERRGPIAQPRPAGTGSQESEGARRAPGRVPPQGHFGHHGGNSDDDDHKNEGQEKRAAAAVGRDGGEPPYVAKTYRRAGAGQDKAQLTPPVAPQAPPTPCYRCFSPSTGS